MPPRFTPRSSKPKSKGKGKSAGLTGMLSALPMGKSKSKPSSSSNRGKKGAGIALLTAAAGFAVSNRDKIGGLLHRKDQEEPQTVTPPAPPAPPAVDSANTTP
jgi:hypothetical protein